MRRSSTGARLLVVVACAACVRARSNEPSPVFPFATDSLRTQYVAPGVVHRFVYASSGPWAIHELQIDLDRCYTPRAVKGVARAVGREKTSVLLAHLADSERVVGGVNGDFFSLTAPAGVPVGMLVTRGRVVTRPGLQPAVALDSAGLVRIARFHDASDRRQAHVVDSVSAAIRLQPFYPPEAVGGRPLLVRDSLIVADVDTTGQPGFATGRHPRTAAGVARNGKRLILVVVDGRQKPYSDGMTLRELANLMLAFGARDALNLDGGGSTTMVHADPDSGGRLRVANRPSDKEGERPVGDALAVVRGCGK
ncbi:MAG TPA: phosphodiester glycosidase family protein [Gemmatimonadaceae bacterium]|nr:phosphodiester glycosidase family protein [Gemmatimonadaceae bacterium]